MKAGISVWNSEQVDFRKSNSTIDKDDHKG